MYFTTIRRGDIFYIHKDRPEIGSEQSAGRPAIIVSNDINNDAAPIVEVVFLTTKQKTPLPTHVDIASSKVQSVALCEQIQTVAKVRVGDFYGSCTEDEMKRIDEAMAVSLALCKPTAKETMENEAEKMQYGAEVQTLRAKLDETMETLAQAQSDITKMSTERDVYKELYTELIRKTALGGVQ